MSTPIGYFQQMYDASPDPWDFAHRWYDRRKHDLTVASLTRPRYASAFEPGCSIGSLTERLAPRCDRLLAADAVPEAVAATADRLVGARNVTVRTARMPQDWPDDTFDLVVLSELGYYFDDADLDLLLANAVRTLEPGGDLVAVHWRRPVAEHARLGDEVHDRLHALPELDRVAEHREDDFLPEVFTRVPPPARSVAQREGLC